MATPPTFVTEYESAWNTSTQPKTASVTVGVGDLLVVVAVGEADGLTVSTPTGGGLTYTLAQSIVVSSYCSAYIWTAPSSSSQSFTLSVATNNASLKWGFNALRFSGSDGVGGSSKTNVASGAPSLALTTTTDNAAIVAVNGDFQALDGASRTWRTINSITPTSGNGLEQTYFRDSSAYTVYCAYWNDVGTAGSKTTGLSAPSGQKYSIIAVEVKGQAGGGATVTPSAVAAVAAVPSATPSTGSTVSPAAVAAVAAAPAPTVSAGSTVAPGVVAATAAVASPTLAAGSTVTAAAVAAAAAVPSVTVATGSTVAPAAVQAVAAAPAVTVQTGATVTPSAVAAVAAIPTPAVSAGGSATISPSAVASVAAVNAATLSTGSTVAGAVVAALAAVADASVSAGVSATVSAAVVAAVAAVPAPTVAGAATVTADVVAGVVSVPAPTLSASVSATRTLQFEGPRTRGVTPLDSNRGTPSFRRRR